MTLPGRGRVISSRPPGNISANKIVMAAGLGNISLFSNLGKEIPLVPQKGQLLVTERLGPFYPFHLAAYARPVAAAS
jgi:glycine/D-amino acid oxidase-like deaminating enzyme